MLRESDGIDTVIGINYGSVANGRNKYLQISTKISNFINLYKFFIGTGIQNILHAGTCITDEFVIFSPGWNCVASLDKGLFRINVHTSSEPFGNFYFQALGYIDKACLEWDGNLVYYGNNTALWKSGTNGSNMILFLADDGSFSLYKGFVDSSTFVKKLIFSCPDPPVYDGQFGTRSYPSHYNCTLL